MGKTFEDQEEKKKERMDQGGIEKWRLYRSKGKNVG